MPLRVGFCCLALGAASSSSGRFTVAEIKPHYQCKSDEGTQRVRDYVQGLVAKGTGLISLIEAEFEIPQPSGYTAFGAACGKHVDPVVVLVDEAQFSVVSTIGATAFGNYSHMPYIGGQTRAPDDATNSMCISDPTGTFGPGGNYTAGSRPYAGAVLLHKSSGQEFCMLTGTFAHCLYGWTDAFVKDVDEGCGDRQLLIVADTNAGCEVPTIKSESHWSMNQILANHSKQDWGPCHDASLNTEPTCCNDYPAFPYPRYWYDRTSICRGGRVEDFQVEPVFYCQDSFAEHKFTTATVHLATTDGTSDQCLDHSACAKIGWDYDVSGEVNQVLPADGLCCPTSAANQNIACCDTSAVV